MRVLLAGISTRAAAESAALAGFDVTAIDAFGDLDQHPSVVVHALRDRFSADAAARAGRAVDCDAVAYLSNFENHPDAVRALAASRPLWGNAPEVLQRVRDPVVVAEVLRRRRRATPRVLSRSAGSGDATWVVKPLASGGGHRVRRWRHGTRVPGDCYLQELVEGPPGSVVFVAAGGRAVPLGITRQLIGEEAFGASGFRYCGNILLTHDEDAHGDDACALATVVAEEFDLVGVNGVDFVAKDGVAYGLEVNPRWCASMELVERAYGVSVFGAHAAACRTGALPDFDLARARRGAHAVGKAVVFAKGDVLVGDTRAWLEDKDVRDVPHPDQRIDRGRPVCTVFAAGRDATECHTALVRRAERIYAELDRNGRVL